MKRVALPFGKESVVADLPDSALVVYSKIPRGVSGKRAEELVRASMERPHAALRLQELLSGKRRIAVLITD